MDAALGEPRELEAEKNHSSSDGLTCSGPARPEVNSLLTKIADTISNIQQQQPLPSGPTPLSTLGSFDPSALLSSLTSQGTSIDSLLDSLTRGTAPLLSSAAIPPLPAASTAPSLSHTASPLPGAAPSTAGPSSLPTSVLDSLPVTAPSSTSLTSSEPTFAAALSTSHTGPPATVPDLSCDGTLSRAVTTKSLSSSSSSSSSSSALVPPTTSVSLTVPVTAPRAALAINGVPAVMATVVARSVSAAAPPLPLPLPPPPAAPLPLPPPPAPVLVTSALVASALPLSTSAASLTTQLTTAPPPFTATPLTTSHFSPPHSTDLAVAPPTQNSAPPTGNHTVSSEPFLSAPLPSLPSSSLANELITQGPALESAPILEALSEELVDPAPSSPDVQALVNELTGQGLPPSQENNMAEPDAPQPASVDSQINQEPPPPSMEVVVNEPITQVLPPAVDPAQPSPPSLHANEELLSDDSDNETGMEVAVSSGGLSVLPAVPPIPPAGSRSDSASPYTDDASFASFVAGEAHDTGSVTGEDHFSPSPSPLPAEAQNIDGLMSQMHSQPPLASSSSRLAMQAQFGATAYCPRAPILPPPSALPAPLDMTVQNFPKRSKYAHRAAMSAMHPYHRTRGGGVNVAKTLDLLKAVLQSSFNMEVKRLCDDYLQLYLRAAANIRENTGDNVPEATLHLLVNKMLEEAQQGYQKGEWEFPSSKLPRNEKVAPATASPMTSKKVKGEKSEARYGPPKRSRRPPADQLPASSSEKTSWKWSMDKKRVDPGKWRPDTLSPDTHFVLGVNVNKALGHGANRGKVYYLHPELFKYACDGDDKTWLYENNLLPVHGGKAFLMILKEVKFLVSSEECYRDNRDIVGAVKKLQEFQVPQFMLEKMKTFMRSVQGYFAQEASSSLPVSYPTPPPASCSSQEEESGGDQPHS